METQNGQFETIFKKTWRWLHITSPGSRDAASVTSSLQFQILNDNDYDLKIILLLVLLTAETPAG